MATHLAANGVLVPAALTDDEAVKIGAGAAGGMPCPDLAHIALARGQLRPTGPSDRPVIISEGRSPSKRRGVSLSPPSVLLRLSGSDAEAAVGTYLRAAACRLRATVAESTPTSFPICLAERRCSCRSGSPYATSFRTGSDCADMPSFRK
jgi:hypothetical protein